MNINRRHFVAMTAALPAILAFNRAAAQGSTPIVMEEQPTGVLGQVHVDQLPVPHAEVWFIRFTLEPGGSLPMDLQIGPTVVVTESREATFVTDKPVEIDGVAPMATPTAGDGMVETVATAGQVVYVHEDTSLAVRNDGDAPWSGLTLLVFSGVRETEAMDQEPTGTPAEPVGLSQMPVGVTAAEFPEGPGTITIERVVLDPNATAHTEVPGGAIVGGIERGMVTMTVVSGEGYVWPGMARPMGPEGGAGQPRRTNVAAGDSSELSASDGFGLADASIDWKAGGDGVTMIMARVEPAGSATPMASPAA